MTHKTHQTLWLAVGLLLLIFASRIAHLDSFPIFIDEAIHIAHSERIQATGPLAHANEGRQFTYWYYLLFQPAQAAPIWTVRAATVLAVMVGLAALMASARLVAGRFGMGLVAVFYGVSVFHFFFDRLAMADTLSAAILMIAVYLGLRLRVRCHWRDAVWLGMALFIAVGFKLSSLPFYGIPIAAALAVRNDAIGWRARLWWASLALGMAVGLFVLWQVGLAWRGYDGLSLFSAHNAGSSNLWQNLSVTIPLAIWQTHLVFSVPVVGLMLVSVGWHLYRRQWYLPLVIFAPWAAILLNTRQTPRYWLASLSLLLLTSAIFLAIAGQRWHIVRRATLFGCAVAIALFAGALLTNRLDVPAPAQAYGEYISGDSTGFGLQDVSDVLRQQGDSTRIIGLLSNCWGLRYTAPDLNVVCPRVSHTGRDIPAHEALIAEQTSSGIYVVLEDSPYVPDTVAGQVVSVIRPDEGRPTLTIYHLPP